MNRGLLLDRDGTLIKDRHYLSEPAELEWYEGLFEPLRFLREKGFKIIVITNQSGVARGYFQEEDVRRVHRELRRQARLRGLRLDGIYYCPNHPEAEESRYREPLDCRKPRPGMLLQAQEDHLLDLQRSLVIGDKASDIEAGKQVGATSILVRTGKGEDQQSEVDLPDEQVHPDLSQALEWLVRRVRSHPGEAKF